MVTETSKGERGSGSLAWDDLGGACDLDPENKQGDKNLEPIRAKHFG